MDDEKCAENIGIADLSAKVFLLELEVEKQRKLINLLKEMILEVDKHIDKQFENVFKAIKEELPSKKED